MELWTDLASIATPRWWIISALGVGAALVWLVVARTRAARNAKSTGWDADLEGETLFSDVVILALLGAVAIMLVHGYANAARYGQIADRVAVYLHEEYDLVPLSPVEYVDYDSRTPHEGPFVRATAVQEDGDIVKVEVVWIDLGSQPHDKAWELPRDFDPIDVTITPSK